MTPIEQYEAMLEKECEANSAAAQAKINTESWVFENYVLFIKYAPGTVLYHRETGRELGTVLRVGFDISRYRHTYSSGRIDRSIVYNIAHYITQQDEFPEPQHVVMSKEEYIARKEQELESLRRQS